MLDDIYIVLSHTSHPGNIGATARAMKVMGLKHLRLVNPKDYPSSEATVRSSGAIDVLEAAQVYSDLPSAIADCRLVVGTSARERSMPWPLSSPREIASRIAESPSARPVAILMGRESIGLTNEELNLCDCHLTIPSNPDYSSLNLGAAVQIIAYECRVKALENLGDEVSLAESEIDDPLAPEALATGEQREGFYRHMEQAMTQIGFLDPAEPKLLKSRLRRLFNRSELKVSEINILRGMMAAIEKYADKVKKNHV